MVDAHSAPLGPAKAPTPPGFIVPSQPTLASKVPAGRVDPLAVGTSLSPEPALLEFRRARLPCEKVFVHSQLNDESVLRPVVVD
jgi:hypothetical protein